MNYLTLENINKSYGEKLLFSNINLTIAKGQKIAIIAKNGTGKTTLLRLIAGEEAPEGEQSKIIVSKEITFRYLKQDPYFNPDYTVLEAALDSQNKKIKAIKELELATIFGDQDKIQAAIEVADDLKAWDIEAKFKEILGKLKIKDLSQRINTLSGGQKKRLALAKILIEEPDFLILDEPTNHLDIDMIEWLESYLSNQNLTIFMVTHDRYFLERVCTEIVELERGELSVYRGNYSDYLEKKALKVQNDKVNLEKYKKLYKKELSWIRRQPQARGTKAKARVDTFDGIKEKAHLQLEDDELTLEIDMSRLGGKILELHALKKNFGDLNILNSFSYKFKKGERVGLAGANGTGKTTFIKLLTKELEPSGGKVVIGDTVVFGHYTQDNKELNEQLRVIDAVREIADYIPLAKGRKLTAESLLERFLFPRPQQQVYVSQLSGGEKRRLHLLRILIKNPNFLILDEPTNDLDILTINVLEDFLSSFKGCLLVTSHDRYFMDKLVDHLFVLEGDGILNDFNGSYSEYKKSVKENRDEPSVVLIKESTLAPEENSIPTRKLSYNEKKELENLELQIAKLEKRKVEIESLFMNSDMNGSMITDLSKELGEIEKGISEKEERWLELSEILD